MKKNLIIGIIVLIALVEGVVLWNQKNNKQNTNRAEQHIAKQNDKEKVQEKTKKTIEEIINSLPKTSLEELGFKKLDMSNWKTYKNEKVGFEVRYPQNWTYGEGHTALKPTGQSEQIIDVTFSAPGDVSGGGTWRIFPQEKTFTSLEKIIRSFEKEGGTTKRLKIDGYNAIYSKYIDKQQSPKGENGIFESFLIIADDKMFLVVNDYYSKRNYFNIKLIK